MSLDKSAQNLFNEALERRDAAEQARFLDDSCGADATLRERVEKLLRAADEIGGFMAQPSTIARQPKPLRPMAVVNSVIRFIKMVFHT